MADFDICALRMGMTLRSEGFTLTEALKEAGKCPRKSIKILRSCNLLKDEKVNYQLTETLVPDQRLIDLKLFKINSDFSKWRSGSAYKYQTRVTVRGALWLKSLDFLPNAK
jgi:hypothetical protein